MVDLAIRNYFGITDLFGLAIEIDENSDIHQYAIPKREMNTDTSTRIDLGNFAFSASFTRLPI
jgi:hypothetical protein